MLILLFALQISACGTEEFLTAVAPDFGSSTSAGTNDSDGTNAPANIKLSWVAPAEREDNSPISLSEIAGFKVYFGTVPGLYPNSIIINDSSAVDHTFTSLPMEDTYYFSVTTLDTEGRESQHSPEVEITI